MDSAGDGGSGGTKDPAGEGGSGGTIDPAAWEH